jgi:pilus assembly protein FimV
MNIRASSEAVTSKWQTAASSLCVRSSVVAIVSCLALSGLPLAGHAASLGNIAVFSSLGQALRAEIEVSATREEFAGMKAQLVTCVLFR